MFNRTFLLSIIAAALLCTTPVRAEEPITSHTRHQESERQEDTPYYTLPPLLMRMVKICTQDVDRTNELIELNREHIQTILNNYYRNEHTAHYLMLNPSAKKISDLFKKAVEKQKPLSPRHMISCLTLIAKTIQHHIIEHHDAIKSRIIEKMDAIYGDSLSEDEDDITERFFNALVSEKKHKRLAQTFLFIHNLPQESQESFIKNITGDTAIRRTLQEGFLHPDIYLSIRSLPDITTLFPQLEKTNKLPALLKPYTNLFTNPELSSLVLTTLNECIAPTFHENTLAFIDAMTRALSEPLSLRHQE